MRIRISAGGAMAGIAVLSRAAAQAVKAGDVGTVVFGKTGGA